MLKRLTLPILPLLAVIAIFASTAVSAFADERDFVLVNESELVITHIYISHHQEEAWGSDILGQDVLLPGESVSIHFLDENEDGDCVYDIWVNGEDGAEGWVYGVDLCTVTTVTFS